MKMSEIQFENEKKRRRRNNVEKRKQLKNKCTKLKKTTGKGTESESMVHERCNNRGNTKYCIQRR